VRHVEGIAALVPVDPDDFHITVALPGDHLVIVSGVTGYTGPP
jgi:hypothetical protein